MAFSPERREIHMRATASFSFAVMAIATAAAAAAGCSAGNGGGGGGRLDGGPDDDGGGTDTGSGRSCETDGDCPSGEDCTPAGRCLASGTCINDADCEGEMRCGGGSNQCLDGDTCFEAGDCPEGRTCNTDTSTCEIGGECGSEEFGTTRLAPNMMILLDRSGSMDNDIGGSTRWGVAKDAIQTVTERFDTEIRFGLATYSSCEPGGCSAGSIVVPIADMNASAVNGFLDPLVGEGSSDGSPPQYLCDSGDPETSTGKSLFALVGEPSLQDPDRANTVLLVTDGAESGECTEGGSQEGPDGAAALLDQDPSVETYVVGFSSDVDTDELDAVAAAGGTETFHPADDADSLISALDTIASDIVTCDFRLDEAPPDTDELYVYFNDDPAGIPEDADDGWTYDESSMTLTFHGSACDMIMSRTVDDIDVVFGCEGPVLE